MSTNEPYRWSTNAAAVAYDKAASVIHPCYDEVQSRVLDCLPFDAQARFTLVDLGGGSGRFLQRFLSKFPQASGVLVDQSEAFLAIAEQKLAEFAPRVTLLQRRLQDDWESELPDKPQSIVSMSAIHHLEPAEKQRLYARCYAALSPGGLFINGDEFRPADDAEYLARLQRWSAHMKSALERGDIPASFQPTLDQWQDRNIRRFGEPKTSGDDCLETSNTQCRYLLDTGFQTAELTWSKELWGVLIGRKA